MDYWPLSYKYNTIFKSKRNWEKLIDGWNVKIEEKKLRGYILISSHSRIVHSTVQVVQEIFQLKYIVLLNFFKMHFVKKLTPYIFQIAFFFNKERGLSKSIT
jgi:hypothetical protein